MHGRGEISNIRQLLIGYSYNRERERQKRTDKQTFNFSPVENRGSGRCIPYNRVLTRSLKKSIKSYFLVLCNLKFFSCLYLFLKLYFFYIYYSLLILPNYWGFFKISTRIFIRNKIMKFFSKIRCLVKKIGKFLNAVRILEISYQIEDDSYYNKPIINDSEFLEEQKRAQNIALTIDFYNAKNKILERNFENSIKIIENSIEKEYIQQDLLPIKKQVEYEALRRWQILQETNLVDDFNNLKPAILEVLNEVRI